MTMHVTEISYPQDEQDEEAKAKALAEKFLSEPVRKKFRSLLEEIVEEEFSRLEEYADEHISNVAAGRAYKFLRKVMEGDQKAMLQLLGSIWGDDLKMDRYKESGYDAGKPWPHLIHGEVFETDGITLRRKIVEAHADLLKTERMKDLEAIIHGLTLEIIELERQRDPEYGRRRL